MERREGAARHIRGSRSMNLFKASGDFGASTRCNRLDLGQANDRILPLELADERVFIGTELIQRADGNLGAVGSFIESKGFDTLSERAPALADAQGRGSSLPP